MTKVNKQRSRINNTAPQTQKQALKLKKYDVVSCAGPAGSTMTFGVVREVAQEPDIVWTDIPNTNWQEGYTVIEEMDDITNDAARNKATDLLHSVLTEDD
jgi:hypothetical protein